MSRGDPFRSPMLGSDTFQSTTLPLDVNSTEIPLPPSVIHRSRDQRVPSIALTDMDIHSDRSSGAQREAVQGDISYQGRATPTSEVYQRQSISRKPFGISFDGDASYTSNTLPPWTTPHADDHDTTKDSQHERNFSYSMSSMSSTLQSYEAVPDTEQMTPKILALNSSAHAGSGTPTFCRSKKNIYRGRGHWLYVTILILAFYSTTLSALWLAVAARKPRFGHMINTSAGLLSPMNASTLTAAFAKTIELSFVTVFVAFVGQVLSRRAYIRQSKGITIAEMSLKSWVTQPGTIFTSWHSLHYVGSSILGCISFLAVVVAVFYTTASATIVAPKLKLGAFEQRSLYGRVTSSFGNPGYIRGNCQTPITAAMDKTYSGETCIEIEHAGQAFHNFMEYLGNWVIDNNSHHESSSMRRRTLPTAMLYDNTTVQGSWINNRNGTELSALHGRMVNNISMAMPHSGVFAASKDPINSIMQPQDFSGLGLFYLRASVPSPAVNVLCAGVERDEIAPLVYDTWPMAQNFPYNGSAWPDTYDLPSYANQTPIDDLFEFGEKYGREPPIFPKYPLPFNTILRNTNDYDADALYVLANSEYNQTVLCSISASFTTKCSTRFNASMSGNSMSSHCEDPDDPLAYWRTYPNANNGIRNPDWVNTAWSWALGINLNGGISDSDDSIGRLLTQLIPNTSTLDPYLPSISEALAVLSGCALLISSLDAPFVHFWNYTTPPLAPPQYQEFPASLSFQDYASGGDEQWQGIFYVVLGLALALNLLCLGYFARYKGLITDFVEPRNLFALALNSPPSHELAGACGGGPEGEQLQSSWYIHVENDHVAIQAKGASQGPTAYSPAVRSEFTYEDSPIMKTYSKLSESKQSLL
ncbi:hypothetical protein MMC13_001840 [Lambiella insularis]|nr:hypothetical protein [Lambiella insularis]